MLKRPAFVAALAAVLAFAWGALDSLRPFATFERDQIVSTPGLGPLAERYTFTLQPGDEACIKPVTFTPETEVARLRILSEKDDAPAPIDVTASAPGYRSTARLSGYPTGFDQTPPARLTPPDREVEGQLCARNAGARGGDPVQIVGTGEIRLQVAAETLVNGKPVDGKEMELTLLRAERRSLLAGMGTIIGHVRAVAAGYAPEWLLWILAVLAAVGIPVAVVAGLYRSFDD